ncbi:helix-turn-helix domain-containing protein [Streptomyces sp. NPDC059994]|uniref:helix-turn-helix domain-containing protein n=1 Tax=Streptomyces sp. NPDC059994 TaxID=3347029 RepID=UPI0036885BD7
MHPQTVRRRPRLRRIERLFGSALNDPDARFEPEVACASGCWVRSPACPGPGRPPCRNVSRLLPATVRSRAVRPVRPALWPPVSLAWRNPVPPLSVMKGAYPL